jgi:hypothetical protein
MKPLSEQSLRLAQQKLSDGFTDEAYAIAKAIVLDPDNEDLMVEALSVLARSEEANGLWLSALQTWGLAEATAVLHGDKEGEATAVCQQANNLAAVGAFQDAIAKLDLINISDIGGDLAQDVAVLKHRCKIWNENPLSSDTSKQWE